MLNHKIFAGSKKKAAFVEGGVPSICMETRKSSATMWEHVQGIQLKVKQTMQWLLHSCIFDEQMCRHWQHSLFHFDCKTGESIARHWSKGKLLRKTQSFQMN